MRNRNSTFDWAQVQSFLATAETGSFSGAAKALGSSQPTVGRHVASLERDLNLLLFDRVGKSLTINDKGLALVAHAKAMKEAADLFGLSALGQNQSISGSISITANDTFCAYLLPTIIERIRIAHPDVQVDIVSSNDVQDLERREADIAIRNMQPTNPNLYAKRIRTTKAYLYGASSYFDIIGRPATLKDISKKTTFLGDSSGRVLQMLSKMSGMISTEQFSINANSGVAIWEAVKQGLGLAVMFEDLANITPSVEAVLQQEVSADVPIWLVTHAELKTNAKIRVIFDILSDELAVKSKKG